jgi:hypothetical protein
VPKDVVVVLPCPQCNEFVVFFREKTIGLKRDIINGGTFDERKEHIAEVIAEFLEGGFPWPEVGGSSDGDDQGLGLPFEEAGHDDADQTGEEEPISQSEVDRFVKLELQRIDDPAYFRRMFE